MKKPLVFSVVGLTATGKTAFALQLAEHLLDQGKQKVILLAADSKQVFQGLEILSGADIPSDFQPAKQAEYLYPYFVNTNQPIELHGVACVFGDADWSVAHFQRLFENLYGHADGQTAIVVVGGTGLYHQQIFSPAETTAIKPDLQLRRKLDSLPLKELQQHLQTTWPARWKQMNNSDRNNQRRLIRAIEVSLAEKPIPPTVGVRPVAQFGLQLSMKLVETKIAKRVDQRLKQGVIQEVRQFEKKYRTNAIQAKATLGYQLILKYLSKHLTLDQLKAAWTLEEIQYAKRQQTWWQKRAGIEWLSADKIDFSTLKSYNFS
ncbi:MAG: tRNA dimethylallyltransferase [Candidatus Pacebacteria bacterium GW2011_GWB1_47_8]|nr:MAG: tRNA dimethylallyltransferase [Candidatus Pacebacteria bacterium GW2011_GWA1_46_10]KKU84539.1 MAG: tRNA dimethylallyltransferase [Candidatus Pacebacteria bacterium GW2011_GWB1_47_8]HCR81681.1 hypothetical protein [Candidatus Paceibacterota bacterium]